MVSKRSMFLLLWLGGVCLGAVPVAVGQERSQAETETPAEEVARLNRETAELRDIIEMLMENLSNCAEENESLSEKAPDTRPKGTTITGEQVALLDDIRNVLGTEENLAFLAILNERELKSLLRLIEERVSRSKQP